jgi:protein SCO1
MPLPRPVKFFGTIAIALGVILFAIYFVTLPLRDYARRNAPDKDSLPILSTVPEFSLMDQDGKTITLNDMKGKIWLADLIFTKCEGICPRMSSNFSQLQTSLSNNDIHLVSFSVDPEYDRGEVLKSYANRFNADPAKWTFVTGNRPTIFSLAKQGFLLGVDSAGLEPDNLITHSEKFVLIDRKGRMRSYYDGTDSTTQVKIKADIECLQAES